MHAQQPAETGSFPSTKEVTRGHGEDEVEPRRPEAATATSLVFERLSLRMRRNVKDRGLDKSKEFAVLCHKISLPPAVFIFAEVET